MFLLFNPLSSRRNLSNWSSMYWMIARKLKERDHGYMRSNKAFKYYAQATPLQVPHLSVLSIESPYPGVSTTVSLSFTPRSSISTVDASNFTVWFVFSVKKKKNRLTTWSYEVSMCPAHNIIRTYPWHLEPHAPDIDQLEKDCLRELISLVLIPLQPSAWIRSLSSLISDELGWVNLQSQHNLESPD